LLSSLSPPPFTIGPNFGYVWTRFTIAEVPVPANWDGHGTYDLGETEDYLLKVAAVGAGDVPRGHSTRVELEPATPNPFRSRSDFAYTLDAPGVVRLTVMDAAGRMVAHLSDGWQSAGRHTAGWNGTSDRGEALPAGTYFIHARSGARVRTMKVVSV